MKKVIGAVLAVSMIPAIASADTFKVDPLMFAAGGVAVSYEYAMDDTTGIVVDYSALSVNFFGTSVSTGIMGATYKSSFDGSKLGNGGFWRAGAASIAANVGGLSVSTVGPAAAVGYDMAFAGDWRFTAEIGMGVPSLLSVGYTF